MQNHKFWALLRNIALVLWSLAVIVIFMYFPGATSHMHRATLYDFSMLPERLTKIPVASYLWDTIVSLFGMAFFGVSCISLGMRLVSILHMDESRNTLISSRRGAFLATCFLIGNTVFSLIFLTLASLSYLSAMHSSIILSLGFLSGLTKLKRIRTSAIRFDQSQEKVFALLSITILVVTLFQSASHLSYDASANYFSVAKLTSLQHHAGYYLENTFPVSMLQSVISYTAVMQVFGDQSARMISWLFGAANIVIAVGLADLVGTSTLARRIIYALILTSTAFLDQLGDGKVELFSSAYALIAIYWLVAQAREAHQDQILYFLSGCFIGFSCILRPYNVFLLGIFVLIFFIQQIKRGRFLFLQAAYNIAWVVLGASGFAVYHLVLNKVILGAPLAFWSSVTGINPDGPWDFKPEVIWIYRLLYPFVVTFKNTGASLGNITPLILVFLPTLAVSDIRKGISSQKAVWQLVIPAAIALASWVILSFAIVEVRYVIFLWIILFIPVAEIAARAIETENVFVKTTVTSSILLLMTFVLVRSAFISIFTYSPVDEQGNPQCFDNTICGHFATINKSADPGERVLTLSAFRYYLRTDLFVCSTNHKEYKVLKGLTTQNMEEFWLEVYRKGYRYIAYEKGYSTDHVQLEIIPSPENTPDWIELEPIFGKPGDLQVAYRINVIDPPIKVESTCKRNSSGIWEVQSVTP